VIEKKILRRLQKGKKWASKQYRGLRKEASERETVTETILGGTNGAETDQGKEFPSRASNSVQLRHYNERVILQALELHKEASKAELARFVQLTPPAISTIVDSLEDAGLVRPLGKCFGGKGQPALLFGLNPDGAFTLGLHVGRRSLEAVLTNFCGDVLHYE
jgi:predicted transcriptional regulator